MWEKTLSFDLSRCGCAGDLGTRRQAHRDGQATFGSCTDVEVGSVGLSDLGDDGQAEAETVRTGGSVRDIALEGLEQTADLI